MELAERNVLAAFRDMEAAQQAIDDLANCGFTEDEVSLLGQPLTEVRTEPEAGEEPGVKDGNVPSNTFAGVTVGSLGGGALGLAGTALVAAIPGVGIAGLGLLAGAVAGAGLGGTVGGIVEGEAAMRSDHSWGQAVEAVKAGSIVVGVHAVDRVEEAVETLASHVPQHLHVTDARGSVLEERTPEGQPGGHLGADAANPEEPFETEDSGSRKDETDQQPFDSRNA